MIRASYRFMQLVFFCGIAVSAMGADSTAQNSTKPNIVFIFADDMGYGDVGAYGAPAIKTPNIDRMAAEGAKFNEFYAASPVCTPSRAALLTGRYPIRQGIHDVFYPESFQGMDPEETTVAEVLKSAGYATGIVGKWHLGHHEKYMPWNQGFDQFFGVPYSNDMGGLYYFDNQSIQFEDIDQRYMTQTYTEKSLDFIEAHQDEPFFLYLAHNMPHVPLYASPEFEGKSAGGLYGDVIEELDWSVGEILKKLHALNLSSNTLVVFTSDNGPWLLMGDHGGSAAGLREGKQFTFEGGMRVPAVAYWPGHIPAGIEPKGLATMMDWLPTFANLANASLPDDRAIDGKDIGKVLIGEEQGESRDFYYYMSGELRAYRRGDWKLKLPYEGQVGALAWLHAGFVRGHETLLFNLQDDPGEKNNLAKQNTEKVASMMASIEQFKASLGDLPTAKKTGKNMIYGPYVDLLGAVVGKVLLVFGMFFLLLTLLVRKLLKRLRSPSSS